jgi:hypothetical protein
MLLKLSVPYAINCIQSDARAANWHPESIFKFAMQEAMVILSAILQPFRFQWQSEHEVMQLPSITLRPKGGILVKLADRH